MSEAAETLTQEEFKAFRRDDEAGLATLSGAGEPMPFAELIVTNPKSDSAIAVLTVGRDLSEQVSVKDLSFERIRRKLISIVRSPLCRENPADGTDVDSSSIHAAAAFLKALPENRALPKVGPDSDGDILMVWEGGQELLLAFDKWRMHAVANPATQKSIHISDLLFDGETVPGEILSYIPKR